MRGLIRQISREGLGYSDYLFKHNAKYPQLARRFAQYFSDFSLTYYIITLYITSRD